MRPLLITPGDPAGIGPEIALKALARHDDLRAKTVLMGNQDHLQDIADHLGISVSFALWKPSYACQAGAINLYPIDWAETVVAGQPDSANSPQVIDAIKQAVTLTQEGHAAGIVTCPIAKSVLYDVGFAYPGHTEYLESLSSSGRSIMMLANDQLKVIPATIHIPLHDVPKSLSTDALYSLIIQTARALTSQFGITTPRIALCGLNPHAGENGAMGREEMTIVSPAIKQAQDALGTDASISGPHAADSLFHPEKRSAFDCVIGMYHDQVLIPVKTIDFHGSVNVTLGLDFIRTSPDHGTAFDNADKNFAKEDSLINAIKMADQMAQNSEIVSKEPRS